MKLEKINTLFSKAILKKDITFKHNFCEESFTDIVSCSHDIIFYIPSQDFIFDLDKIVEVSPFFEIELEEDKNQLERAEITNHVLIFEGTEYQRFLTDKFEVLVDRKALQYFNSSCHFKVLNDKSEVFVFEDEKLAGRIKTMKSVTTI